MSETEEVTAAFRALVESADRKYGRVRDVAAYGRGREQSRQLQKVFKAYMRLWKFQQVNRARLVSAGLKRWEIGEIASRIGQLYFGQYLRTSEARFLVEAWVFYEAILSRSYFQGFAGDLGVRFKELRFMARFLLVSFILNRIDMVTLLFARFKSLLDDSRANFRDTNFKEWKQVVQDIVRLMRVDTAFLTNMRPLRYCAEYDARPESAKCLARFHANRVLRFRDAILSGYHRNEVKFGEFTLDTFRMLQCLEWEVIAPPPRQPAAAAAADNNNFDYNCDNNGAALTDINLSAHFTDPNLPPNPTKAILYRPCVSHFISVLATISEELPLDCVLLLYLSASGKPDHSTVTHTQGLPANNGHSSSSELYDSYLWFGPRSRGGSDNLYPGDIIPFTRRSLFLIVDSDASYAFKAIHGAERGEPAALLLSPLRPSFKNPSDADISLNGSQFTFFLTAPLPAFCQLLGLSYSDTETDIYNDAEEILSTAFSEWEVILCTSKSLHLVWAQVLSDPFLRRIILRFILCRSILYFFVPPADTDQCLPTCLPALPNSMSPDSQLVRPALLQLAKHFKVSDSFHFHNT